MPRPSSRRSSSSQSASGSGLVRGVAGRKKISSELKRTKEQAERRKAQYTQARRFWMPPGSERTVIVLDDEPWAFRHEHALMNAESGRRDFYVPCIFEKDDCPACHVDDKEGAYVMYLTVLDLEPYTIKNGKNRGKTVEFSRRLFVVKSRQQNTFTRKYDAKGSLRGFKLKLYRDGDKDSVIGNEIEFVGRISEEKLARYKSTYKDRKGKTVTEDLSEVLDYDKMFPAMDREALAALVGHNAPVPGSDAEANSSDDDVDGWDDDVEDDTPWEEDKKPKRQGRGSSRGSSNRQRKAPKTASREGSRRRPGTRRRRARA